MATLQSLRLSVSGNEWAPSRHGNETTREKRDLAGTRARKPLEDRGCTFKGVGLNAADKKVSALSPMENIFLDIPFYRTFWRDAGLSVSHLLHCVGRTNKWKFAILSKLRRYAFLRIYQFSYLLWLPAGN